MLKYRTMIAWLSPEVSGFFFFIFVVYLSHGRVTINVKGALQWCHMAVVASQINSHLWWRHQMETFSESLAICAGNSPVVGEFPAQRPVTRSFGFSFICVWINGWVNNREAGDLRRYRAHYDVTVMIGGGGFPSQRASNAEHVSMWWRLLDQQPWRWLCRVNESLSTLKKDSNYQITTAAILLSTNDGTYKYDFTSPQNNKAIRG